MRGFEGVTDGADDLGEAPDDPQDDGAGGDPLLAVAVLLRIRERPGMDAGAGPSRRL